MANFDADIYYLNEFFIYLLIFITLKCKGILAKYNRLQYIYSKFNNEAKE
jgi:hypothetical protein